MNITLLRANVGSPKYGSTYICKYHEDVFILFYGKSLYFHCISCVDDLGNEKYLDDGVFEWMLARGAVLHEVIVIYPGIKDRVKKLLDSI